MRRWWGTSLSPPNNNDQYSEPPPAGTLHTRITKQVVERALYSQSVKKAPGPDRLSFDAIRLLWKWDEKRIVGLTKAAIHTGRNPAVWKRASGVVIRKPGKDNYWKLKVYRTISLLRWMGHLVERVVAELLSEKAEQWGLQSEGQFGSRNGRSAIDPVAIMVDRAHAAWTNGQMTGVLLMDIKAAFPSVTKGRLVNLMNVGQIERDLIPWTDSIISERTVDMIIEGNAMKRHWVEPVIQQCSPVSPILFALYTSGLIKWVEEYISANGLSFVKDVGWVVTRWNVNQLVTILKQCAAKSIEWASWWRRQFHTAWRKRHSLHTGEATRNTTGWSWQQTWWSGMSSYSSTHRRRNCWASRWTHTWRLRRTSTDL